MWELSCSVVLCQRHHLIFLRTSCIPKSLWIQSSNSNYSLNSPSTWCSEWNFTQTSRKNWPQHCCPIDIDFWLTFVSTVSQCGHHFLPSIAGGVDISMASTVSLIALAICVAIATAESSPYDVIWTSPSYDPKGAMPTGNGDAAITVWTDQNQLYFFMGSNRAMDENTNILKVFGKNNTAIFFW